MSFFNDANIVKQDGFTFWVASTFSLANDFTTDQLLTTWHHEWQNSNKPWVAIENIHDRLKPGARVVTFSPCIEQVQRNCAMFAKLGYHDIQTYENLSKPWAVRQAGVKKSQKDKPIQPTQAEIAHDAKCQGKVVSYQLPMRGHTSYLTVATKAPLDEMCQPE